MVLEIDDYRFLGLANTVATEEFSASFDADVEMASGLSLLREYKAAGSPEDKRQWLRNRLRSVFVSLGPSPRWIEPRQMWPFLDGRAMTFIHQFQVEANQVSAERLAAGTMLYHFGIREPTDDGGWKMCYRTVEQHPSLA